MGIQTSKGGHVGGTIEFSSSENEQLEKLFRNIAGHGKEAFNVDQLKEFLLPHLPANVTSQLFAYMKSLSGCSKPGEVHQKKLTKGEDSLTRNHFNVCMWHMRRGSVEQKARLLVGLTGDRKLKSLQTLLRLLLRLCESTLHLNKEYSTWKFHERFSYDRFIDYFLFDLVVRDGRQQCDVTDGLPLESDVTLDDVDLWLSRMPILVRIINIAFYQLFPVGDISSHFPSFLPFCDMSANRKNIPVTVLDLPSVLFLNNALPHELRSHWRLLFSTVIHGESFATMLKKILNEGPTVFVIKDKIGHVFGGFASDSWALHSNFYGSSHSFLFSLFPLLDTYLPSGYNNNFLYLNQNQQTLPNGLGMGGQFNYCGLWLDQEFGTGHSKAQPKCTTYGSPQLSSEPEFSIDFMEVWAVGPPKNVPGDDEEPTDSKKKSGVLKIDRETKALLEMLDKPQHSEAIREADEKEEENVITGL